MTVPRLALLAAVVVAMAGATPAGAQEPPDSAPPAAQDSTTAMQDSTPGPSIRLVLPHDSLVLRVPLSVQPGGQFGLRTPPSMVAARWARETRTRIAEARRARARWPTVVQFAEAEVPRAPPPLPPFATRQPGPEQVSPGQEALSRFADLGLQLQAAFKLTADQYRNLRCTAVDLANPASGCQGGFPTPSLDALFNVRAGGVVGDRVHINLDYDSENEFSANNNINVYYQGLEDEILQRVDVGNVTFNAPSSRFLTAAVPANSFGVQAEGQLGAFEWRGIVAQQKGSQLVSKVYTVGETTTQPVDREMRDLDYETGRFFFTVSPRLIPGYPDVDPLGITGELLPASRRPVQMRVYRLRAQSSLNPTNPNLGGILAVAVRDDSPQRVGPFQWELLVEGHDYYLDPSGLWFALAQRVGDQDFLAVSYITASGDTVGTFPAINGGSDTLQLIYEPRKGPEVPTFYNEMRNVYRIGGSDVVRSSIDVSLAVNESEQPLAGGGTYLSRLGLALSNDESTVDQYNRVFPRERDPNGGAPINDLFLVFPNLQPFADSARLQAGERNDSLYRTPTYLLSSQGPPPRFRIRLHYEASGGGDRGSLSLGNPQIREGSEKLFIGNTQLTRGRDYEIDYAVGLVTFLNPESLFHGETRVRAEFEENQAFDVAPQSLYGFSTTYSLGSRGHVSGIVLSQQESSLLTRPQLGFEPQANFLGGVTAQFTFRPDGITRALDALPLISTSVPSNLSINGELAMSRPNPNRAGQAYIEEFEGGAYRSISLVETQWQQGSRPSSGRGLPASYLGPTGGFADADAVPLVWQSSVQSGNEVLQFSPTDIDSTIVLTGAARQIENVMWLTLKADTIGGAPNPVNGAPRWFRPHTPGPRWRSITQPLGGSGLGVDLSRVEYLEFWVLEDAERAARDAGAEVIFDFGTIFEDAVAFGPDSFRVAGSDTTFSGFQFVGIGKLDTERDTLTNVFNASVDDIGILGDRLPSIVNAGTGETLTDFPMCEALQGGGLPVYLLGDLGARCTRGNGFPDSEDLNGDDRLDITVGRTQEDMFRFIFKVGDERYFVRTGNTLLDGQGRPLTWRLYRIPFRVDTLQIGAPSIRQVQSVRMTVVAPDQGPQERDLYFALARMRLEGAPWLKRAATPIAGLSGAVGQSHGEVVVSTVSTENRDLGYTSPPGVTDQASQVGAGLQFASQQINEKSLRLLARDLRVGERAEAFLRFTDEANKNLLRYGSLRVWARGRGPGWEDGDLEFFIKAGRDENNFYMYHTPVRSVDWLPEVVIDLQRWLQLRAQVEAAWLRGEPPSGAEKCGGDSTAYVACDGPYFVEVRDPGVSPPNLARVSEMAVGILRTRQTVYVDQAELWVDDIRLDNVVDDMGLAGAVDVRLQAADVADLAFSYQNRGGRFQQLGESPTFSTDGQTRFGSTIRLDKFLPGSGFSIPFNFQTVRTSSDPLYLNRSDVLAGALPDLRRPRSTLNAFSIGYRKIKRGNSFLERAILDPFSLQGSLAQGTATTTLSDQRSTSKQVRADYNNVPQAVTTAGAPSFLVKLLDALPGFIRNSEFGRSLHASQLRVNPAQLRGSLFLVDNQTSRYAYRVPVALAADTAIRALTGAIHTLRGDAGLSLQPYQSLNLRADISTTRDLQDYGDSTTMGRLLGSRRQDFLGLGMGFERQRVLTTGIRVNPAFTSWLRPRFSFTSAFSLNRDPNQRIPVREDGDTAGAFRTPETLSNSRSRDVGATFAPARLIGGIFGDSSFIGKLARRLEPIDVSVQRDLRSSFDRSPFDPSFAFQLGLGTPDEFRQRQGVLATSAARTSSRNAAGSVRLPLGLLLRLRYRDQETHNWSLRGGQNEQAEVVTRLKEWPSASTTWTWSPRGGFRKLLSIFNTSVAYVKTRNETVQPDLAGGTGSVLESRLRTLAPTVNLTWAGGVQTSLQYRSSRTDRLTSGNVNRTDQRDWDGTVNFSFRTPIVRLPNEIRTTAHYARSTSTVCLIQAGSDECTAVSESYQRTIDIRMDTGISPQVRGGANFTYRLTAQRQISQERSQMVFSIFVNVFLISGQFR